MKNNMKNSVKNTAKSTTKNNIKITPIGGLGEIGMNMMVIEYGKDAIIVDCGVMFADAQLPGVDLLIPNFTYLRETKLNIHAVIITHGHEDHVGALPYLLFEKNVPVYGSRFTMAILKRKLEEFAMKEKTKLHTVKDEQRISVGPFDIEFIRMSHSISDAMGLAIDTPMGTIIHTGDFKIDQNPADGRKTDMKKFEQLGKKGVLLLLSDSTNVEVPGHSLSESSVKSGIEDLLKSTKGWFILCSFASHIPRIQQVLELATMNNRKVYPVGRSMVQNIALAKQLGYLDFPDSLILDSSELKRTRRDRVAVLSTGSQGEARSALARMAVGEHKELALQKGDSVVFSSRFIPGNEKNIYSMMNNCCRRGAEVFTNTGSDIHVSGHAYKEDLRDMLLAIKPKFFIPVHGEYRHLVHHVQLAQEVGMSEKNTMLLENGEPVMIFADHMKKLAPIDVTKVAVDGLEYVNVDSDVVRDRRRLSEAGTICIGVTIDHDSGEVLKKPVFKTRGICSDERMIALSASLREAIVDSVDRVTRKPKYTHEKLEEEIRVATRRFFYDELQRKPVVMPFIVQV